jgi:succinate dehydrogenase / fumarate reductase flavoprotein subunit
MGNEYTLGGIMIDEKMRTSVNGLYAAGECTSGTFGSNRVADAVTEMIVQGYRAGQTAVEECLSFEHKQVDTSGLVKKYTDLFHNENGITAIEANLKIEQISDKGIHFIRNEDGLKLAIKQFEALEEALENVTITSKSKKYNMEWIRAIQAKNRLICAKLSALMALERQESRGLHLRSDFPYVNNDDYIIRQFARMEKGKIKLYTRKPIITTYDVPVGGNYKYFDYILQHKMGLENLVYNEEG